MKKTICIIYMSNKLNFHDLKEFKNIQKYDNSTICFNVVCLYDIQLQSGPSDCFFNVQNSEVQQKQQLKLQNIFSKLHYTLISEYFTNKLPFARPNISTANFSFFYEQKCGNLYNPHIS